MAGKDKTERGFRIYWDDAGGTPRDLTADLVPGSISGGGLSYDEADMTGVSQKVRHYLVGHASSEVVGNFHMNDTATTGATTVLNATQGLPGTLTLQWGANGAAPTTGDIIWTGEYILISMNIQLDGNKHVHACRWLPTGTSDPDFDTL